MLSRHGSIDYRAYQRPDRLRVGPLDRFHPERFLSVHPVIREAINEPWARPNNLADGVFSLEGYEKLRSVVRRDRKEQACELPLETIQQLPALGKAAPEAQTFSLASHHLRWRAAGRQIYDIPPGLADRFRQTDVDDVPLSILKFPYKSLYIHWESQRDIELEQGWCVDGAYVQKHGDTGAIEILVTSAPNNREEARWWPIKTEPYFYQVFKNELLSMDVGMAVDSALSNDLAELQQKVNAPPADTEPMRRQLISAGAIDPSHPPIEDVRARTASQEIERLIRRREAYAASLKLVINTLAYITAYPDDSRSEYPASAPVDLVRVSASTDLKKAKKARSKLEELGYLPVHICGQGLLPGEYVNHDGGRHMRAHWRRGHWRRQPYGEGRSLRRLIWVMPMIINKREDGDLPGHLYLVS